MAKVLSIKQPWASLICTPRQDNILLGIKDIENRTWQTKFRGRILVHVSAKKVPFDNWYDSQLTNNQLLALPDEYCECSFDYSAIIGEVDIVDCVINHSSVWAEKFVETVQCPECGCKDFLNENLVAEGYRMCKECHQDWYIDVNYGKPIYNWVLANPVLYDTPILNVKGKLSFWEYGFPEKKKPKQEDNVIGEVDILSLLLIKQMR